MKRIAIVGIGNRLMGDDGFGSYLAEALEGNVKGCDVIDLGASGVSSLEILKDYDVIILIDAIMLEDNKDIFITKMDQEIDSEEITSTVVDFQYSGSHGLGIQSVITTLRILGYTPEVYVFGCKPYVLDVKMGISDELMSKLDQIITSLYNFLKKFGIEFDTQKTIEKLKLVIKYSGSNK